MAALVGAPIAQGQTITIVIHDYAGLAAASMQELQTVTRVLLSRAGIGVEFVECTGPRVEVAPALCEDDPGAGSVLFRILAHRQNDRQKMPGEALGSAVVSGGYGSLYVAEARWFAEEYRLQLGTVLAYALAHEIGHLLLGSAHGPSGIMRAAWGKDESRDMDKRHLGYADGDAKRLRAAASRQWRSSDSASANPALREQ